MRGCGSLPHAGAPVHKAARCGRQWLACCAAAPLTVVLDANILLFNIYGARAARDPIYINQSCMVSVINLLGIIFNTFYLLSTPLPITLPYTGLGQVLATSAMHAREYPVSTGTPYPSSAVSRLVYTAVSKLELVAE